MNNTPILQCRQLTKRYDQGGLDVVGHDRHDDEEAPHAEDDRWDGGEQFDGGADGAA